MEVYIIVLKINCGTFKANTNFNLLIGFSREFLSINT